MVFLSNLQRKKGVEIVQKLTDRYSGIPFRMERLLHAWKAFFRQKNHVGRRKGCTLSELFIIS